MSLRGSRQQIPAFTSRMSIETRMHVRLRHRRRDCVRVPGGRPDGRAGGEAGGHPPGGRGRRSRSCAPGRSQGRGGPPPTAAAAARTAATPGTACRRSSPGPCAAAPRFPTKAGKDGYVRGALGGLNRWVAAFKLVPSDGQTRQPLAQPGQPKDATFLHRKGQRNAGSPAFLSRNDRWAVPREALPLSQQGTSDLQ